MSQSSSGHDRVTFDLVTGFFNGASQTYVLQCKMADDDAYRNCSQIDAGTKRGKALVMTAGDLSHNTKYSFRVYAFNRFDRTKYSDVIEHKTALSKWSDRL